MTEKNQDQLIQHLSNNFNQCMVFLVFCAAAIMIGRSIIKDNKALIENAKKYSTFIFIAIAIVAALLMQYLNSPEIDPNKYGGAEQFGQFGDYIGGILNPIFGFITVLLLIHTANLHTAEMTRDKNMRDIESLHRLIEKSKQRFDDSYTKKNLIDSDQIAFSFQSTIEKKRSMFGNNDHEKNGREKLIKDTLDQVSQMNSLADVSPYMDDLNHYYIFKLREEYKSIIKRY